MTNLLRASGRKRNSQGGSLTLTSRRDYDLPLSTLKWGQSVCTEAAVYLLFERLNMLGELTEDYFKDMYSRDKATPWCATKA